MNSTPAASNARWIASRLFVTGTILPASKFRTVLPPTVALAASSVCENSIKARAARHCEGVTEDLNRRATTIDPLDVALKLWKSSRGHTDKTSASQGEALLDGGSV